MKFWRYVLAVCFGLSVGLLITNRDDSLLYKVVDETVDHVRPSSDLGAQTISGSVGSLDERVESVMDVLRHGYFYDDRLDESQMQQRAIKAYVDALADPYTVYLDASENEELEQGLVGEENFEGIGARVMKKDQGVMIEQVLKGSPALEAGLKPLDLIVAINGTGVNDESLWESVERIRGPEGTSVELTIWRGVNTTTDESVSNPEVLTFSVTRGAISYPSVLGEIREIGDRPVGYIVISSVGDHTVDLLRDVILDLRGAGVEGVVLDLRGNGGGFLDEAVNIVSYFVPKDELVVQGEYRVYKDDVFLSYGYTGLQGLPTVVMVDGYTASAGEIIALALRDITGATIVGSQSFGKGTIQTLSMFDDGSSLKYTVGERLPPSGISINGTGIIPDVVVEFDQETYAASAQDNQLEYVKSYMKNLLQ